METLLETWRINCRINLYLLAAIGDDLMLIKLAKGKSVAGNFTHIHNVRLMWLKAAAPNLWEGQTKFEDAAVTRAELDQRLNESAAAIEQLIASAESPEGRIKGFKPHAAAFVGYLIAHEQYHRTCVELALRQNGTPLDDKTSYGMWEWGVR
jgi:uncharacterized damage-inducible protein DinB